MRLFENLLGSEHVIHIIYRNSETIYNGFPIIRERIKDLQDFQPNWLIMYRK